MAKSFLFLQGPHGPFFRDLGRALRAAGHGTIRLSFNGGDAAFWAPAALSRPFHVRPEDWFAAARDVVTTHNITDLVMYGDSRPIHLAFKAVANQFGLRVHCFEEGYLRPYWITYERGGTNGASPLMSMSVDQILRRLDRGETQQVASPASWGALWAHSWYGALYHGHVLAKRRKYPAFTPHRDATMRREFALNLKRVVTMPLAGIGRRLTMARLMGRGRPFHVVLLQLAHDANMRDHSPVRSNLDFTRECLQAFARGAPQHHHLVLKAHPLEDGREPLARTIRREARALGIAGRVWFLSGGKLGPLLDRAASVVTVNSTAAQQALWRGLPVKAMGRAVYCKPEFVSHQSLDAFFADPREPDREAYLKYRQYLLETSQIRGSFYTARGRANILREVVDRILSDRDPYGAQAGENATAVPNITLIKG